MEEIQSIRNQTIEDAKRINEESNVLEGPFDTTEEKEGNKGGKKKGRTTRQRSPEENPDIQLCAKLLKITRTGSTSKKEKSIIDYIVIRRENTKDLKDVRTKRGYEMGTDHYFLEAKFRQEKNKQNNPTHKHAKIKNKIRSYKLRNKELREKYAEKVDKNIEDNYLTGQNNNVILARHRKKWRNFVEEI
ncbi:hypothetical protein FQA39_LY01547 [Lamprigera yunnana]|nr:hypothetical protein FQA39_LY01547 [Lamprigera yunnana]